MKKRFKLTIEKPGVISKNQVFVFLDFQGYMYVEESLIKLIWILLTEWQSDKHLVG